MADSACLTKIFRSISHTSSVRYVLQHDIKIQIFPIHNSHYQTPAIRTINTHYPSSPHKDKSWLTTTSLMPVLQNMISIENPPSILSPLKHPQLHNSTILRHHQPSASPKSSSKDAKIACQNASKGLIAPVRDARRKRTSSRTPTEESRPLRSVMQPLAIWNMLLPAEKFLSNHRRHADQRIRV